jgi:pyruvate kinase
MFIKPIVFDFRPFFYLSTFTFDLEEPMERRRRTKIVATIGPASSSPEMIEKLIDAGMNVARLNFSHGVRADHEERVNMIREIAARKGVTVGILQDVQGPKIRTGKFKDKKIMLENGAKFIITSDEIEGDQTRVSTTYKGLPDDVRPGLELLLDDGNLSLRVDRVIGNDIHTTRFKRARPDRKRPRGHADRHRVGCGLGGDQLRTHP